MGKRIITQARGKGSGTYRVRRKAFKFRLKYPPNMEGEGTVIRLLNSPAHSAPLAKISCGKETFYIPAFKGMIEGQKIVISNTAKEKKEGSILRLGNIPIKTSVYNIESRPGDGGVFIKSAGSSGVVNKVVGGEVYVLMPSKKVKKFHKNCRAILGVVAGSGRLDKPVVKAGKKFHIKRSRGKLWPRTSAVKMNVVDHPFGSGRGKVPKSKVAKRNAPPGKRVGHLRPKRTGKKK
ncbi:MAG: 50S ribosomal protein L2 [Nanoarchaeota archaeon]|nr:50S ribosomal protein L2 [Nanoarchaeota archaeon]MBU1501166.1 50S ribosomal protein L2 [Nanoarchaeota archaeon]MBU2458846.1 50S ribosomal protein L2 [Nanoarchaeota archaeon]